MVASIHEPAYFDFTVTDVEQAKSFFEQVFDWRLEKLPGMPYDYYRIRPGAENEPGIDAGIGAIADTASAGERPLARVTIPAAGVGPAESAPVSRRRTVKLVSDCS